MASSNDSFNPFAPGFDFFQKLSQAGGSGGAAFPSWSDWVAPTMSVEELDKRINELKTVLFWLEQNQRALAATIQAMEVQKMTLSALHTMNVPVENWASAVVNNWQQFAKAGAEHAAAAQPASAEAPAAAPVASAPVEAPPAAQPEAAAAPASASAKQAAAESIADPLNWWSALTQQFQHIAQQAVQDVTQHAMQHAATTQDAVVSAAQTMAQQAAPAAKRKTPAPPKRAAPARRPAAAKTAAKTAAKRPAAKKPAARKPAR